MGAARAGGRRPGQGGRPALQGEQPAHPLAHPPPVAIPASSAHLQELGRRSSECHLGPILGGGAGAGDLAAGWLRLECERPAGHRPEVRSRGNSCCAPSRCRSPLTESLSQVQVAEGFSEMASGGERPGQHQPPGKHMPTNSPKHRRVAAVLPSSREHQLWPRIGRRADRLSRPGCSPLSPPPSSAGGSLDDPPDGARRPARPARPRPLRRPGLQNCPAHHRRLGRCCEAAPRTHACITRCPNITAKLCVVPWHPGGADQVLFVCRRPSRSTTAWWWRTTRTPPAATCSSISSGASSGTRCATMHNGPQWPTMAPGTMKCRLS